jgi:hypothetical protein
MKTQWEYSLVEKPFGNQHAGEQRSVFDLVWPDGVQEGLSQPVAILLNEGEETLALASSVGFRCFTDIEGFKAYLARRFWGKP